MQVLFIGPQDDFYSKTAYRYLLTKKVKAFLIENPDNKNLNLLTSKNTFNYVLHFGSKFKFKKKHLNCSKNWINFHFGLPKYPGVGGVSWAIYNNDSYTGITVHKMNNKLDNGEILFTKRIKIKKNENLIKLHKRNQMLQLNTFKFFVNQILKKKNYENKHQYNWANILYKYKDLEKMREIKLNHSKAYIKKIIRAFCINEYRPYTLIKGHKFIYEMSYQDL